MSARAGSTTSSGATRARRQSQRLAGRGACRSRPDQHRCREFAQPALRPGLGRQSSWTKMIDAAAGRGQAGTVLVMTGTGFQRRCSSSCRRRTCFTRSPPRAYRAGFHRADDRCRGAFTHVSPEDAALVDRFLDMMAAEAGASRHTLAAYRNDLERAAEGVSRANRFSERGRAVRPGTQMGRACALDRRTALSGAAALLWLPRR